MVQILAFGLFVSCAALVAHTFCRCGFFTALGWILLVSAVIFAFSIAWQDADLASRGEAGRARLAAWLFVATVAVAGLAAIFWDKRKKPGPQSSKK